MTWSEEFLQHSVTTSTKEQQFLQPPSKSKKGPPKFLRNLAFYFLNCFRGYPVDQEDVEMSGAPPGRRQKKGQGSSPRSQQQQQPNKPPLSTGVVIKVGTKLKEPPTPPPDTLPPNALPLPPNPPPPEPLPALPLLRSKYLHASSSSKSSKHGGAPPTETPANFAKEVAKFALSLPEFPQYRPGFRVHTTHAPQQDQSLAQSTRLPPSPGLTLTIPGRDKLKEGIMGNQGIRQHVETSTKTGVFHLSKAKLHEFPPELAKIVNALRNIDLSDNKISIIPQNISAFVNLKHLNLNSNQIEIIPDQIGQLSKLETLSLANNRIKSVPGTIAHLQKLRDANLSSNALSSFPVVFSSLKFLTVLDLARNRIPEVPDGVGGLQVVELILNQNQVRVVSKELALCPNLKTLRLQENTLELGGLPTEILSDSPISLLSVEGNLFDVKQLSDLEGYEKYMDRYTNTKKKLM